MRVIHLGLIFLVALSCSGLSQEYPSQFETLDGVVIPVEELARERWALGFVVVPGCPACEDFLPWFSRAAQAFPEISFLLVAPEATQELKDQAMVNVPSVPVLLDRGGVLGAEFEVEKVPTVVLSVEGAEVDRLVWPFTEGGLFRKLAESLLVKIVFPDPKELLGQQAPGFVVPDLEGRETSFAELPRPLLLVFINPGCPSCWEVLPALSEVSKEVAVALLVFVGEDGLSEADRGRLEGFLEDVKERPLTALLVENFELLQAYRVARIPTYFLLDGKGVITEVWEGYMKIEDLLENVRTALSEDCARDEQGRR